MRAAPMLTALMVATDIFVNAVEDIEGILIFPMAAQVHIDECRTSTTLCAEGEECKNTPGSSSCSCPRGYHRDGTRENGCTLNEPRLSSATAVFLGLVFGISSVVILILGMLCAWRLRKRRQAKHLMEMGKAHYGMQCSLDLSKRVD
ncbi:hypothetical protein Patl1_09299 [Pistacia atlantica]|uniref:Uncharacterized protein n=1 Tax=Pistacia atlantica TaxID=434234 RepID=A0ACC1AKG3_9ROSI|nr:hypothetical protein Patl1_09299 [Pistacia atlantica]